MVSPEYIRPPGVMPPGPKGISMDDQESIAYMLEILYKLGLAPETVVNPYKIGFAGRRTIGRC